MVRSLIKKITYKKNKFTALFYSTLSLFLLFPLIPNYGIVNEGVMGGAVTLILISAAYAVSNDRKHLYIASSLAAAAILTAIYYYIAPSNFSLLISSLLRLMFFSYIIWLSLRFIMRDRVVDVDTIYGSICVYFLMGVVWAHIFFILEIIHPGSFVGHFSGISLSPSHTSMEFFGDFLYFSYVTLTSLGYGDMIPVFLPAKIFAILETMFGQIYLTVLVARFVGLHIKGLK